MSKGNRYDNETKAQALRLMKEIGATKASKQLGIQDDTIKYWDIKFDMGD